ncbi:hypothetical protein GCM10023335_44430 [Streptomyces siamensis]|uniref:Uncharacterized protein n=1 Tax=Streptomyces siamensis TaxID=1274986 RepID=A0ABP9J375_9ACTN
MIASLSMGSQRWRVQRVGTVPPSITCSAPTIADAAWRMSVPGYTCGTPLLTAKIEPSHFHFSSNPRGSFHGEPDQT